VCWSTHSVTHPSPTDLPCFLSWVACHDYPAAMFGFGCHLSAEIALTRSITEAAQTRLAYIAGARDDLQDQIDDPGAKRRRDQGGPAADIGGLLPAPVEHDTLLDDLESVVKRATAAFGYPPLMVDLTREEIGVPVVKVVVPGSRVCPEVL
jgi:ribosomal protein S12 methylthiotransferase accessory factor